MIKCGQTRRITFTTEPLRTDLIMDGLTWSFCLYFIGPFAKHPAEQLCQIALYPDHEDDLTATISLNILTAMMTSGCSAEIIKV